MKIKEIFTVAFMTLAVVWSAAVEAAQISNIRTSTTSSQVRVVLDSNEALEYKDSFKDNVLTIMLPNGRGRNMKPELKDKLVQGIELQSRGNGSVLTLKLSKSCKYKIFKLGNPHRLVIDLPKIIVMRQDRQLTRGVTYSFIQDDFQGKQLQAHLVTVEPEAKFEWRPFSMAGNSTGRGSLATRAGKLGLPVAVNASYFDTDGWVIGNTKDQGKLLSMETTPRSAFAVINGKSEILKDVAYSGQVRLSDGTLLELKGMNRRRIAEDLVIYNQFFGPSTKTNHWGREVKVRLKDHLILAVSTLGNMTIEPGTIVISGHGAMAAALAKCRMGDQLVYFENFNSTVAEQAETLVGAGPMLVEEGIVNVRTQEEQIARDISWGRAPRTAVGIRKDGATLVLVVDGRSEGSIGLTLPELARYLQKLGAWEAVNFDGGGSSEICIDGKIVNRPSDGKERLISVGLGLFPKR